MCSNNSNCNCGCENSGSFNEGLNGYNSFTYSKALFTIPPADGVTQATFSVLSNRPWTGIWATPGTYIYVDGNYFRVVSSTQNSITVVNPQTETEYTTNSAPGTIIPTNVLISQTGPQGPPVVLPRRSVVCNISDFQINSPYAGGSGYQPLIEGNLTYLTQNFDVVDAIISVRPVGGDIQGYKLVLGGQLIHEITDVSGTETIDGVIFHKIQIQRTSETRIACFSEIAYAEAQSATLLTDTDILVNGRMLKKSIPNNVIVVPNTSNMSFEVLIDTATPLTLQYFTIKFTPYDN